MERLEERLQLTAFTYSATDVPLPVPPEGASSTGTTVSTISVPDTFVVQDVNVRLNIEHAFDGDLTATVIAPNGVRVILFDGIGGPDDNFSDTLFDQQAATAIRDGDAPYSGTFRPQQDPAVLNGLSSQGDWQLEITDSFTGDAGFLLSWSLVLDDTPPDIADVLAEAASLTLVAVNGVIETVGDVDFFSVQLPVGLSTTIVVEADEGALLDPYLRLFDEQGAEVAFNDNADASINASLTFSPTGSGAYFLGVSSTGNDSYDPRQSGTNFGTTMGRYELRVITEHVDAGSNFSTAQAIVLPDAIATDLSIPSYLNGRLDVDLYAVDLAAGEAVTASLIEGPDTILRSFDSNGREIDSNDDFVGSTLSQISFSVRDSGRYFIGVTRFPNRSYDPDAPETVGLIATDPYLLQLRRADSIGDDVGTARFLLVTPGSPQSVTSAIDSLSDVDVFAVTLLEGNTLRFQVTSEESLRPKLRAFDAEGSELEVTVSSSATGESAELALTALADGTYYLGVSSVLGDGGTAYSPKRTGTGLGETTGRYTITATQGTFALEPAAELGVFSLRVDATGEFQFHPTLDNGENFAGAISLMTREGRLLRQNVIASSAESVRSVFGVGTYLLKVTADDPNVGSQFVIQTDFVPAFNPTKAIKFGDGPDSAVSIDVNGDRHQDLVVANAGSADISVLLGHGDGTFEIGGLVSVGGKLSSIAAGRLNSDEQFDLVVTDERANKVVILLGQIGGTFVVADQYDVGDAPAHVLISDLNNDGVSDIATANGNSNDISVLLGRTGDGTFESARHTPVLGFRPQAIAAADFDGDGLLDVVSVNQNSDDISILHGNGDGTFLSAQRMSTGVNRNFSDRPLFPSFVSVADLNGDGAVDIVAANSNSNDVAVFLAMGSGFSPPRQFPVGTFQQDPAETVIRDFNGDGVLDVMSVQPSSKDVSVILGVGDGTFLSPTSFQVGADAASLVIADFNEDGRIDFVTTDVSIDTLSIGLGRGDGTFQKPQRRNTASTRDVALGDFDGDGNLDAVIADGPSNTVTIRRGRGDGTLETGVSHSSGGDAVDLISADFNNDGRLDVLTINLFSQQRATLLLGHGDGSFDLPIHLTDDQGVSNYVYTTGDFDGDGTLDLVTGSDLDDTMFFMRQGLGGGQFGPSRLVVSTSDKPNRFTTGDFNQDGQLDLAIAVSNVVSIRIGDGNGSFSDPQDFATGNDADWVAVGDLNFDGRLDLVTASFFSRSVSVVLALEDETFAAPQIYPVDQLPFSVEIADFNDDGFNDIASGGRGDLAILYGIGDGQFSTAQAIPNERHESLYIAIGDLNLDRRPDVVLINDPDVETFLTDDGRFITPISSSLLANQSPIIFADLDTDGHDDVLLLAATGEVLFRSADVSRPGEFTPPVVVNPERPARDFTVIQSPDGLQVVALDQRGSQVSLYQFQSTELSSEFRVTRTIALADSLPVQIASGNFDHDPEGYDDFGIVSASTQGVSVYLSDANGFRKTQSLQGGEGVTRLVVEDVTNDGAVDLVVANQLSGDVSVFANDGHGVFETSIFATGKGPYFVDAPALDPSHVRFQSLEGTSSAAVGQVTGDGFVDIVVTNPGGNSIAIVPGLPNGRFAAPQVILLDGVHSGFASVLVADLNGDGHADAIFADEQGEKLSVYLNQLPPNGLRELQFAADLDLPTAVTGLALRDANADGALDLFATSQTGDLLVLSNNGQGAFAEYRRADRNVPLAVQDLNGDGQQDVVLANASLDRVSINYGGSTTATPLADRTTGVAAPASLQLADLNRDGVADLIVPNTGGNSVLIYKGRPDGTYETGESIFSGSNPSSVTVSDLDGDTHMDLIVTNRGSNTVAVFYGQAAVDSQTVSGATLIPFRAGALTKLPSGSGPVDAQVVSLPNADGSMQTGLVVTNSTSNSVSFIPSAGNGIFNATPTNTVPLGFSPLPGAIVNNNLVLPNPGGNSLGFLSLSAALFGNTQPPISFAAGEFDRPIGIDGSTDLNGDGFFDLLVANNGNGSISLLLGGSNSFDFSTSFFLNEITNASALQVADFNLYVTQAGQELFTVFDLATLQFENNGPIPSFEEISGEAADSVASTNRPIDGLGRFAPLLLALFGQFPLEEGETSDDEGLSNEPASWQSLVQIVTQVTQQFDRLSEEIGNRLLVSMFDSLSTDWGLPKLTNSQAAQLTFETLVLPLGVLTGTQPVTQLVRTLRRLWPQRPNAPANRPAGSSTSPATKTPVKVPMKAIPGQSSVSPAVEQSRLAKYMTQLTKNPTLASELFDRQSSL